MAKQKYDFPVLLAFKSPEGYLSAWCPYCVKFHYHSQGEGHRSSHCYVKNSDSPLNQGGYEIMEFKKSMLERDWVDVED